LLLSIGAGAAGAFTGSSAITLALGGTIALAIVMRIVSAFSPQRSRAHFPWEYVVPFFFALFATVPIGHAGAPAPQATLEALPSTSTQLADAPSIPAPAVVEPGTSAVTALLEADGGEGSIRLEMWSAAVELIATSPIVGLGPGPHVPWRHPLSGEVTLNEAHNTILDLLLVAGVLGLAAALLPVAIAFTSAWRGEKFGVALLTIAPLGAFSMFHYVARQPLVWILIAACIVLLRRRAISAPHGG